ncbi:hypothetical protein BLNAU_5917 [Blattamonas nauphoetae]|uniref:Uncharacterized protein n=1 Tax=Blattamonas nauphoetae TaxID=2049346 RepID=A0ABQ9XJ44_9EUKA|nr:hypothetical protein BLNAU_13627 [Blattamonas nauphoetae]KAK2959122.1 hypothetical protein BLNAU_5917 [Blattamonas nauphoetae]
MPTIHTYLTTLTGKTRLLNTKTEYVHGVFYRTTTSDINLGKSFLFSNNPFLHTTQSNAVYACPGGTYTSPIITTSTDVTIRKSIIKDCKPPSSGQWTSHKYHHKRRHKYLSHCEATPMNGAFYPRINSAEMSQILNNT